MTKSNFFLFYFFLKKQKQQQNNNKKKKYKKNHSYIAHFPKSLCWSNVCDRQLTVRSHNIAFPFLPGWWTSFPASNDNNIEFGSVPELLIWFCVSILSNKKSHTGRLGSKPKNKHNFWNKVVKWDTEKR